MEQEMSPSIYKTANLRKLRMIIVEMFHCAERGLRMRIRTLLLFHSYLLA